MIQLEFTEEEASTLNNALHIAVAKFRDDIAVLNSDRDVAVSHQRLVSQFAKQIEQSEALLLKIDDAELEATND